MTGAAPKVGNPTFRGDICRKSMLHTIAGIRSMIEAQVRRTRDGEGGLAELAALAALKPVLDSAIDDVALHLLRHDEASYKEIAAALDRSKAVVVERYRSASTRPRGAQEARLR